MAETDWGAQQEAIRQAISLAMKLPDRATIGARRAHRTVVWYGEETADRWTQGEPSVELRLLSVAPRGQVESRTVAGLVAFGRLEHMTVGVAVDVDCQTPGRSAPGQIAGRLRTRLQRDDVRALLEAADVALVSVGNTTEIDYEDDGRLISAARTDIVFSHAAWDEDTLTEQIEHVQGSGDPDIETVVLDVQVDV